MTADILVLGATGNVGAEVTRSLIKHEIPVCLGDLEEGRVREKFGDEIEFRQFVFGKAETYMPAFEGIQRVFIMRPPQITDISNLMVPAMDAALAAGVEHFVFLSLIGIENNTRVPHYRVESYLQNCGKAYTFLRASFFMQNLNTALGEDIRHRDEIAVPVGNAKTAFIDVRDIGAVGALALREDGHENQAYELTGGEALDYYQVAGILSDILGRKITYSNPSLVGYFFRSLRKGDPLPYALVTTWLYNSTRQGMASRVTGEVARLLGRPPISLRQYAEDYREHWMREAA